MKIPLDLQKSNMTEDVVAKVDLQKATPKHMATTPIDDEQVNIGEDVTEKHAPDSQARKSSSMLEHINEPP